MSWLSPTTLLGIVLGFLFVVASAGEAFAAHLTRGRLRAFTYVPAASVYWTAWTFYGSVGLAAKRGLEFLTIYLGPACVAVLWPGPEELLGQDGALRAPPDRRQRRGGERLAPRLKAGGALEVLGKMV